MFFTKKGLAEAAQEVADHLRISENIKSLQTGQKELSDALVLLGERIRKIESDFQVLKAETKFEALKETQIIVNGVQGNLNSRIEQLAIDFHALKNDDRSRRVLPPPES